MVGVAQLVSAPDCGSGGRGFESLYPPCSSILIYIYGGIAQLARAHGSYPWCRWFKSSSRYLYGILAQLGEHLPYKQRVIGSSPIGSICRSGGTGRRTGLKILRDLYSRIGSIPIAGIL